MKICILGDSVSRGVLFNAEDSRYVCGKNGFAERLAADGNVVDNMSVFGCTVTKGMPQMLPQLPAWFAAVHPRFLTPAHAIWFFGLLALLLALRSAWLAYRP